MDEPNHQAGAASARPGIFPGWVVLIAAMCIYSVAVGQSVTYGIFIKPMCKDLGWDRASLTGAFGLYTIVLAVFSTICGILTDKIGPRILNIAGGIIMGLGLFLCSRVTHLWQFYVCYSLLRGVAFACMFVPLSSLIPRWFVEKKGLVLGLFFASAGVGGLIMSPLLEYLVSGHGWRTSFEILSLMVGCIIIPAAFFLKKDPADLGLRPLGQKRETVPQSADDAQEEKPVEGMGEAAQNCTAFEALKQQAFWIFSIAVTLLYTGIFMAQINMVPHATDKGITASMAAIALGIASAVNSAGRLAMGAISDRIGTQRTLIICIVLGAASLFWLIFVDKPWMLIVFAVFFGFSYGGIMPQIPRVISELFGVRSMGSVLGVFTTSVSMGPAIGPYLGGVFFDLTGSYDSAFLIGGVSFVIGFWLVLRIKFPKAGGNRQTGHAVRSD